MKRTILGLVATFMLFSLIGRFVEAMGAVSCACASSCWCKQPGLSLFRWTVPVGHHTVHDDDGPGRGTGDQAV